MKPNDSKTCFVVLTLYRHSSYVWPIRKKSSKYVTDNKLDDRKYNSFINLVKTYGTVQMPKGRTLNSYN